MAEFGWEGEEGNNPFSTEVVTHTEVPQILHDVFDEQTPPSSSPPFDASSFPSPSPSPSSSSSPSPSSSVSSRDPLEESHFKFNILEPEKVGEGMGGFVLYPITCASVAPGWTKEEMKTGRRYSEFLWLFDQLLQYDRCAIIPPLPEKVMTLSKYDKAFLRYRQKELTRFLQRVGAHHSLSLCPALKTFMTKDALQSPSSSAPAKSSSSGGGWFSFLGDTISTISGGSKPTEPDEYFETKTKLYTELETLTLTLADNSSSYLATYSEKSTIFAKFSEICKEMSEKESGGRGSGDERIAASFHRLSDIGGQLGGLHGELGERLKEFWENDIRDQYRYIVQVKVMLEHRMELLTIHHNASAELKMKEEKLERMPISHADYATCKSSIGALENAEQEAKTTFDEASGKCKKELELFEEARVIEIRNLVILFAQAHLNHLKEEGHMWKGLLSDLQD